MFTSEAVEASRDMSLCRRQAITLTGAFCTLFILVTALYCYLYAFYIGGDYPASLIGTVSCVSIDWLAWALISPILAYIAIKENILAQSNRLGIIKLLLIATLLLGAGRIATDYVVGNDSFLHTLVYFLPRYLFVTAFLVGMGAFYVFRSAARLEIERLKRQQNMPEPAGQGATFTVYRGNCRAVVRCCEIVSITASGNYLELETPDGMFLMRNTMKNIEARLDSRRFARIHRSHIVNLDRVKSVSRARLEANLANGKVLRIGKKYLGALPHFAD